MCAALHLHNINCFTYSSTRNLKTTRFAKQHRPARWADWINITPQTCSILRGS